MGVKRMVCTTRRLTLIWAVCPQRKHLTLRLRLWIGFLVHPSGQADHWVRR